MLPSTNPKASAPRTSTFSVLISPAHPVPLPTLRLPPRGSRRTARGETWFGYSFVPGDLHPLPSASSPGAPDFCTSLSDAANSELEQVDAFPAHRQVDHAVQLAQ